MNKLKDGEEYEKYILNIIKDKYKSCYLWKDIPKNILPENNYKNDKICDDIGCDIIGINHNNTIDYIQCKNYSTTGNDNVINICDLAGFYNFIAENLISTGIVYYSGKLSQQILCRKNKIRYLNIPMIKNNQILDFKPRDYQLEAYNKLKDTNRGILSMPCGTGKTFVTFLLSLDYKNIIIFTPLISTTEQIFSHYKNYYSKYDDINYVLINCNAERNIKNINISETKNIFASTYDSSDIVIKILSKIKKEDTLIIIDEFHNLSQDMIKNNKNNMNNILISEYKIVFVSATPLDTINYKQIFGETKYELTWKDVIKNKYICDYNFYYPNNGKIITRIDDLKIDKKLIEKTILINKSYFLLESIKLTNIKKCIAYLKTIKESDEFVKILKTMNIYFELNIKVYEINYNTTKKRRTEYLNKFKNDNTCINILCNVHVLDEGIDIPECDSIYLTHPNNNPINIIQRISRANRLDFNNKDKIAKIFIWSKDNIKLEKIIDNISKTIDIKYGKEINEYVNKSRQCNNILNINKIENIEDMNKYEYISYLKKNIKDKSDISDTIKFIDEYYSFYKLCKSDTFGIDSDQVIKYLQIKYLQIKYARAFHENLRDNYILNVDYVIYRFHQKSEKNKQDVFYKLSFDGFEKVCLASRSEQGNKIKKYMSLIKKLTKYYE
jgi:superfamily II DNA or RNA helicase